MEFHALQSIPSSQSLFQNFIYQRYATRKSVQAAVCVAELTSFFQLIDLNAAPPSAPLDVSPLKPCMQEAERLLKANLRSVPCRKQLSEISLVCTVPLEQLLQLIDQPVSRTGPRAFPEVLDANPEQASRCGFLIGSFWECIAPPQSYPRSSESVEQLLSLETFQLHHRILDKRLHSS